MIFFKSLFLRLFYYFPGTVFAVASVATYREVDSDEVSKGLLIIEKKVLVNILIIKKKLVVNILIITFINHNYREVDSDDMSEPLLVVEEGGEVRDQDDQHCWHVDRHEVAEDRPLEHDLNLEEKIL